MQLAVIKKVDMCSFITLERGDKPNMTNENCLNNRNPRFTIELASDVRTNPFLRVIPFSVPAQNSPSGLMQPCRQIRMGLVQNE